MGKKKKLIFGMRMLCFFSLFKRVGVHVGYPIDNMRMRKKRYGDYVTCEQDKQEPFFRNMPVAFSHIRAKINFFILFDKYYIEYF